MIFVVGNSRSGTTMMGRVLGGHPDVFTFGELHFFEQMWSPEDRERRLARPEAESLVARLLSVQRQGYLGQRDPERFRTEAKEIVASTPSRALIAAELFRTFLNHETSKHRKKIACDQTPRNVFYIEEILELYPDSQVINLVRDPRDVLLSQKRKWKRRFLGARGIPLREAVRSWANYHSLTISKLWNSSTSAAARFANDPRVHSLRFEDLLADPGARIREICELVGISFNEHLLEVPQIGSSSGQDKPEKRGINREKAGTWRKGGLSATEIFLCQKVTSTSMKRHGYDPIPVSPEPLWLAWSVFSLPLKLALALLLNLKRMRNIRETIKRRLW